METPDLGQKTLLHTSEYLSFPGAEVIVQSPDNRPIKISQLAATLMRLAAADPDRKVNFWMKLCD